VAEGRRMPWTGSCVFNNGATRHLKGVLAGIITAGSRRRRDGGRTKRLCLCCAVFLHSGRFRLCGALDGINEKKSYQNISISADM